MITMLLVLLAMYFGFELGRKWDAGKMEAEEESLEEVHRRGGIRLRSITVRR